MAPVLWIAIFVDPNFDVDADPYPDPDSHQNDGDPHASMFHFFCIFFWRATVCRPLLRLCRPFIIFEGCLDSNPEYCRSKLARYRLSHPSLSDLATHPSNPCFIHVGKSEFFFTLSHSFASSQCFIFFIIVKYVASIPSRTSHTLTTVQYYCTKSYLTHSPTVLLQVVPGELPAVLSA
jgi:hypothetical protein